MPVRCGPAGGAALRWPCRRTGTARSFDRVRREHGEVEAAVPAQRAERPRATRVRTSKRGRVTFRKTVASGGRSTASVPGRGWAPAHRRRQRADVAAAIVPESVLMRSRQAGPRHAEPIAAARGTGVKLQTTTTGATAVGAAHEGERIDASLVDPPKPAGRRSPPRAAPASRGSTGSGRAPALHAGMARVSPSRCQSGSVVVPFAPWRTRRP